MCFATDLSCWRVHLRMLDLVVLIQIINFHADNCLCVQEILAGLQTCRSGTTECVSDIALFLDDGDAELLEAATILHYVGMFINHKAYHKHSHYLIKVQMKSVILLIT